MANSFVYLALAFALLSCSSFSSAAIVEHTFNVQNFTQDRLCRSTVITGVNDMIPGPALEVREGDSVIIHVLNKSPYPLTIHWHGVKQLMTPWADGPEYVTQCPIRPGGNYTYRFNATGQEGTIWWHAHAQFLRQTVYGAVIIRPRRGSSYPFMMPAREFPIILGEWYNRHIMEIEREATETATPPPVSDAFTINGQPGDLYPCSSNDTTRFRVVFGRTYLLRIINAALTSQFFFKIAGHNLRVVAVDAAYTNPYDTDVLMLSPGQSADVLLTANQPLNRYYMAARVFRTSALAPEGNGTTTGIIEYYGSRRSSTPMMPILPADNDTSAADNFLDNITSLVTSPFWTPVPRDVNVRLFVTVNLGLVPCDLPGNRTCPGPLGQRVAASMNNVSFVLPTRLSMLEAFVGNVSGIYTTDFPVTPPVQFDYTNPNNSFNPALVSTVRSTRVMKAKYNDVVEMVLQNTALLTVEIHPMHLHGFNFYVLARGYGNYNSTTDSRKFNLINPQERNTVTVPMGGWAVIRFRANNPGVWFMHCHNDAHVPWGLANALVVENGPTPQTSVPPPPADLPQC